jgi:hypothetical protein
VPTKPKVASRPQKVPEIEVVALNEREERERNDAREIKGIRMRLGERGFL